MNCLKCEICKDDFIVSGKLSNHQRRRHRNCLQCKYQSSCATVWGFILEFICNVCSDACTDFGALRRHKKCTLEKNHISQCLQVIFLCESMCVFSFIPPLHVTIQYSQVSTRASCFDWMCILRCLSEGASMLHMSQEGMVTAECRPADVICEQPLSKSFLLRWHRQIQD